MIRKRLTAALVASTALAGLAVSGPAIAQTTEDLQKQIDALQQQMNEMKAAKQKDSGSDIKVKWEPAPKISSADGRFEMNLRGRMHIDANWLKDDHDFMDVDATQFRTVRLGIEGKAWNNVEYKFEADFAGNEIDLKDAYIGYDAGVADILVGHFKTQNSLEEQTSSRYTTFMERASITDAFEISRQIGVGAEFGGDNWTAAIGVFKGSSDGGAESNQGEAISARVTYAVPVADDALIHLGASYRYRSAGADEDNFRYRQRPHQHLASRFVGTPRVGDKDELFGVELAGVYGPFSMQGEYMVLKSKREISAPNLQNPKFDGWYIDASYFITGESRAYKGGKFNRVKVANPVFEGGMGAWQVAARYDVINLNDENIFGGEQKTWIVGVNWHLNDYSRIMLNYSQSDIKDAFAQTNNVNGENKVDAFGVRFQVDW